MSKVRVFDDKQALARAVAEHTIAELRSAIDAYGSAIWVLAGGSTPLLAYRIISEEFREKLDWTKVTALIGDERIGPFDGPDNNWHAAVHELGGLPLNKLRPETDKSAEHAAQTYEMSLLSLPKGDNGLPRLDVVWLGVGEDGHTLSLFPKHPSMLPSSKLVIPVHDSPKPPADRMSLTLRAIMGSRSVLIIAAGASKQAAVSSGTTSANLPIGLAASIVETHDGKVTWFVDRDAAPTD